MMMFMDHDNDDMAEPARSMMDTICGRFLKALDWSYSLPVGLL